MSDDLVAPLTKDTLFNISKLLLGVFTDFIKNRMSLIHTYTLMAIIEVLLSEICNQKYSHLV